MNKGKLFTVAVLVTCGLLAAVNSAEAASIKSLTSTGGAVNVGSDDSWEYIIQRDGNATLDVGDSLAGIFNMNFYGPDGSQVAIGPGTLNNQWSGRFQTKVTDKEFLYVDGLGRTHYAFAFAPDPAAPWAASAPGAMVLMYEDAAQTLSFTNGPGAATDWANATDGTFTWALGFAGGAFSGSSDGNVYNDVTALDEAWIAEDSFDSVPIALGNKIGDAQFALNRVYGFAGGPGSFENWVLGTMPNFLGPGFTDTEFKGIVQFKSPASSPFAWPVEDDLTRLAFTVNRIVPVPAAAWMGLALLGALGVGRRLRRRR